jgi:Zn-dependent protease
MGAELANGLMFYLVFLFSTTLHEAAHAWMAKRGGDLTAYQGGQVSLSPVPHIRREPFGMVILPLISVLISGWPFGYASAPYNPDWAMRYPKRAATMALAGPVSNLLLVLVAGILIRIFYMTGTFTPPQSIGFGHLASTEAGGLWPAFAFLLGAIFSLNLLLGTFNLLPVPPLDGSGLPPFFLSPAGARSYQQFLWSNPAVSIIGILVAWQVFHYIFDPIFVVAVNLLYPGTIYR